MKKVNLNLKLKSTAILILICIIVFCACTPKDKFQYDWHFYKLNIQESWKYGSGENVTIAIIDSGFDENLLKNYNKNKIKDKYNAFDDSKNVNDNTGHGTQMITIINANKETGYSGVAPKSNVIIIKAVDEGGRTTAEILAKAIRYAAESEAHIINLSIGSKKANLEVESAVKYAFSKNKIILASVGDTEMKDILYPAKYEEVISVEAQSKLAVRYVRSNISDKNSICLPGELIAVPSYNIENISVPITMSGSSYSTAVASGIMALFLSNKMVINEDVLKKMYFNNAFADVKKIINMEV